MLNSMFDKEDFRRIKNIPITMFGSKDRIVWPYIVSGVLKLDTYLPRRCKMRRCQLSKKRRDVVVVKAIQEIGNSYGC